MGADTYTQASVIEARLAAIGRRALTDRTISPGDADALLAIMRAAREWVRVYDAPQKTNVEWANGMQKLRIALAEVDRG